MMRFARGFALALAFFPAAPLAAQPVDPPPLTAELPALRLLRQIDRHTPPARRLELLDQALAMLVQPTPLRGMVLCGRAATLSEMGRDDQARTGWELCRQLRPNDPNLLLALAFSHVERMQPVEAAQLIIRSASLNPDPVRHVEPESMKMVFRQLGYARAYPVTDKLTETLVSTGWARDNPDVFSDLAAVVLRHRVTEGNRGEALALLPTILAPNTGVGMLIDRRFESIWPQVEAWAGADLSLQRRALLDGARAVYETTPSAERFLAYVDALQKTGNRAEAIRALESRRLLTLPGVDAFYRNRAVIMLGRLLAAEGRPAEAIARMKAALTGPDASDKSIGNVVPNLVVHMLLAKDHAGALAILDRYTPSQTEVEAPAAIGYFVALRACALGGVGRRKEAEESLLRVQTVYATNEDAVEIATDCVGSADAQAALWIANARNEERRTGALVSLAEERYRLEKGLRSESIKAEALRHISGRPDVREAYDRLARDLPQGYRPAMVDFADLADSASGPVPAR